MIEINCIKAWVGNGAAMSIGPGRVVLGWGNRRRLSLPESSNNRTLFYFPDFFLKDSTPWFEYENTQEMSAGSLLRLLSLLQSPKTSRPIWKNEHYPLFCDAFHEIKQQIGAKELDKAVPFIFESTETKMTSTQLVSSLKNLLNYMEGRHVYFYGFWDSSEGMLGVTPETLFSYEKQGALQTMACAGTSGKDDAGKSLLCDPKELKEHQIVVDGISESLSPYGKVKVGERRALALPNVTHIVTPIAVELNMSPDFEKLVHSLHPTPALGAFPKEAGKRWLERYQQKIDRKRFGAPVGCVQKNGNGACFVAIRNVQWNPDQMFIGAGCGVVEASLCDREWAEINLKLKAIKEMLSL